MSDPLPGGARAELAILVGLPGSGKTSFARARLARHVHVSKDLLRATPRRDARQLELIREALTAGGSVVVDNINASAADRAPLIAAARELGAPVVGYVMETEVKECLRRNRAREGKARVPDVAIFVNRKRLQPPTLAEGFEAIYRVRAVDGEYDVQAYTT